MRIETFACDYSRIIFIDAPMPLVALADANASCKGFAKHRFFDFFSVIVLGFLLRSLPFFGKNG